MSAALKKRPRVNTDSRCKFDMPLTGGFQSGVIIQDRSQAPYIGTAVNSPIPKFRYGFDFVAASTQSIDIGTCYNAVSTVTAWVNPDDVAAADAVVDLNGTDILSVEIGVLTKVGFAGGTAVLYVDGVAGTTVTANWHLIAITDTVAKDASDFDIVYVGSPYADAIIGGVRLYSYVLTAQEIMDIYQRERWIYNT